MGIGEGGSEGVNTPESSKCFIAKIVVKVFPQMTERKPRPGVQTADLHSRIPDNESCPCLKSETNQRQKHAWPHNSTRIHDVSHHFEGRGRAAFGWDPPLLYYGGNRHMDHEGTGEKHHPSLGPRRSLEDWSGGSECYPLFLKRKLCGDNC